MPASEKCNQQEASKEAPDNKWENIAVPNKMWVAVHADDKTACQFGPKDGQDSQRSVIFCFADYDFARDFMGKNPSFADGLELVLMDYKAVRDTCRSMKNTTVALANADNTMSFFTP